MKFTQTTLDLGERNEQAAELHRFLKKYGYLKSALANEFSSEVQEALKVYQHRFKLHVTGQLDEQTVGSLNMPRCGVPDLFPGLRLDFDAKYVHIGCSYLGAGPLKFGFANETPDLMTSVQQEAIRRSLATWSRVASIDFQEVPMGHNPRLTFSWHSGAHGDGADFDGPRGVLAHAFYPPPCGGRFAGSCHFDDAERWSIGHGASQFDLETVALHEVGHLLGLAHSDVPGAVMFPNYQGERRSLSRDDVEGIQSLYGKRGLPLRVLVHLQSIGDAHYVDNQFAGTRGQSRRLEGFQIDFASPVSGLGLEYMAHLQNEGDVPWVSQGTFIGTRGQSRRLEGFAMRLTGPEANNYDVVYMAHLQERGDTRLMRNGEFCGTRGESRRVEGILVRIEAK